MSLLCALVASAAIGQRTLLVGPGRELSTPSAAAAVAQDGDRVVIDGADYRGDVAVWRASGLEITHAADGRPVRIFADGRAAEGKAIWVLKGSDTRVEGIEFLECEVPDRNGAGIRLEGPGLSLVGCVFRENQTGLLTGAHPESDVVLESCEFAGNGAGDGFSHNIYIGHVRSFTLRSSWSHSARVGHTVKSRAEANTIVYNRLADEAGGTSSYLIDLSNGGRSLVMGNVMVQGELAENGTILSYGREGLSNADNRLFVVQNTIVSDRYCQAAIRTEPGIASALVANNIVVNAGAVLAGEGEVFSNTLAETRREAGLDPETYGLLAGSPAIDAGAGLASHGAFLVPDRAYVHPRGEGARRTVGPIDTGAYERSVRSIPPRP